MRTVLVLISLLYCTGLLFGQPQLQVSATQALIGDQIELVLRIPLVEGQEWINADVMPADTVPSIEVIRASAPEIGRGVVVKRWTIAVFDTGYVRVPPVPVVIQRGTSIDTVFSNDIPLQIEGVVDSAGMAPIKPIEYEPVRFSDYMPYLVGGLLAFLLLMIAGIWWARRPRKQPGIIEIRDEKPAHVLALGRLDQLEAQQLWQQGQIKSYHSILSHIVRQYLEHRYQIQALEYTTEEIIVQLLILDLGTELLDETAKMMRLEDLVKFAKATPPMEVHASHMEFVRGFIQRTRMLDQMERHHA